MPNLNLRFDSVIEEHYDWQLAEIRAFAAAMGQPDWLGVEIGTNRGKFLAALAKAHPERCYLGVELRKAWAEVAQRRLERSRVSNAQVLRADANHVLPIVADDGQLDELFLLFPDPWWKARHHKRRIIQPEFLDLLARKMRSGGHLWIRTDVGPLADDMRQTLVAHPHFEPLPLTEYPRKPFPRSTRERHVVRQGMPIHTLYWRRS